MPDTPAPTEAAGLDPRSENSGSACGAPRSSRSVSRRADIIEDVVVAVLLLLGIVAMVIHWL